MICSEEGRAGCRCKMCYDKYFRSCEECGEYDIRDVNFLCHDCEEELLHLCIRCSEDKCTLNKDKICNECSKIHYTCKSCGNYDIKTNGGLCFCCQKIKYHTCRLCEKYDRRDIKNNICEPCFIKYDQTCRICKKQNRNITNSQCSECYEMYEIL